MIEDLLHKLGLDRNSLTQGELETLDKWSQALTQQSISAVDIEGYISSMMNSVERELHGYDTPVNFTAWLFRRTRRRHLEARLQNYLMLRDFLTAPARAKKFVESQMRNLQAQVTKGRV